MTKLAGWITRLFSWNERRFHFLCKSRRFIVCWPTNGLTAKRVGIVGDHQRLKMIQIIHTQFDQFASRAWAFSSEKELSRMCSEQGPRRGRSGKTGSACSAVRFRLLDSVPMFPFGICSSYRFLGILIDGGEQQAPQCVRTSFRVWSHTQQNANPGTRRNLPTFK